MYSQFSVNLSIWDTKSDWIVKDDSLIKISLSILKFIIARRRKKCRFIQTLFLTETNVFNDNSEQTEHKIK